MQLPGTPTVWFLGGSQHLYGPGPLKEVAAHAREIAGALAASKKLPLETAFKALLTTPEEITGAMLAANSDPNCAGLVLWMHTFSPAQMWIRGPGILQKPFLHLPTQFIRDLPWGTIGMDFMNPNQAAHGDREAGFLPTRMRLARKVVVGHWTDPEVRDRPAAWMRAARAWHDWQGAKFVRFGDNMRQVVVTEGGYKGFTDTFEDLHVPPPNPRYGHAAADGRRLRLRRRGRLESCRARPRDEGHGSSIPLQRPRFHGVSFDHARV